jgi:hypothetical protein
MGEAAAARADERQRPVLRLERSPAVASPLHQLLGAAAAADLAGRVVTGRELGRRREERRSTAFPTGLAALDGLLAAGGGAVGLPRGCLVELVGRASSGRLAAALSTLAAATAAGEAAAFVDLGDHLDPESLAAAGADPDRLLWVRPRDLGEALAAAEAILAGGLPLVVVDLGLPPVPGGRGAEASWLRLARAAQAHGAALLVSTPYRVSGTAAHAVVGAETRRGLYAEGGPPLLQGLALRFTLDKLRGHRPGATTATEILHPQTHAEVETLSHQSTSGSVVRPFPPLATGRTQNPSARRALPGRPASGAATTAFDRATARAGTAFERATNGAAATTSGARLTSGAAGAPAATSRVPGAAGAAAGKLGAGAGPARSEGTSGGVPAPCRRELPTPESEKARAGSRPQPPPRPLATDGDLSTTPPPPRAGTTDGDLSTTPPPPRASATGGDFSTIPPPPRPLLTDAPPLHAS